MHLKTNESRRQVERAAQHKLSSITVPQDTIKWIEKSSNIERLFYFHYLQSLCLFWDKTNIHNQYLKECWTVSHILEQLIKK